MGVGEERKHVEQLSMASQSGSVIMMMMWLGAREDAPHTQLTDVGEGGVGGGGGGGESRYIHYTLCGSNNNS